MDYLRLDESGLKISPLTLVCMSFGSSGFSGGWSLSETDAEPIFRLARDRGITFWDTANVYGKGTPDARQTGSARPSLNTLKMRSRHLNSS